MTMRERMLAVVRGEPHDRVPFVQYSGLAAPDAEVWSLLRRENMGLLRWVSVCRVDHPNCRWESEEFVRDGRRGLRTRLHAPAGTLTEERIYQPTYGVAAAREHYLKTREHYVVFLSFLHDAVVTDNSAEIEHSLRELGDDGLCHASVPRTPYQQLWIEWVSLEHLGLHLVDWPDLLEEVIARMTALARECYRAVARAPIPYVVIPDNITAPAIGTRYFRAYALPLYQELAGIAEDKGIPMYAHLDGDLRPLWDLIGESGLKGIDSLSPPPDNDTSVAAAHARWPEMRLAVNYPSSVHLAGPKVVYETAMRILEEGAGSGRLQIQVSENVPPGVWRSSYPEIVRAIHDWGRP